VRGENEGLRLHSRKAAAFLWVEEKATPMKDVIIIVMLVLGALLFLDNSKKAHEMAETRNQIEQEERSRAEAEKQRTDSQRMDAASQKASDLQTQLTNANARVADLQIQLDAAKQQIADLTAKPKNWVQQRVESSPPPLDATPAPAAHVRRSWRDTSGVWHFSNQ